MFINYLNSIGGSAQVAADSKYVLFRSIFRQTSSQLACVVYETKYKYNFANTDLSADVGPAGRQPVRGSRAVPPYISLRFLTLNTQGPHMAIRSICDRSVFFEGRPPS